MDRGPFSTNFFLPRAFSMDWRVSRSSNGPKVVSTWSQRQTTARDDIKRTNLADSIDKRILVEDVHGSRFEEGACPLNSHIGPLHFQACFLNHLDPGSHVTPKSNEGPVGGRTVGLIHSGLSTGWLSG